MSLYGEGSTIRFGVTNRIVWTEGVDGEGAESYDGVAEHINRVLHGVKA